MRFERYIDKWNKTKLSKILKIKSGKDQKAIACNDGEFKIYGTGGVIGYTNTPIYSKPSVGIGRKGTIDRPFYFDKPFWTVDTLFYSEIFKDDPKFIYYLFQTINWKKYDESTGVPSLSSSTIENINVSIPTSPEQELISNFLTKIDSRIETQNKIISALESQKKALSQHYFKQSKIIGKDGYAPIQLKKILIERKTYSQKDDAYPHVTLSKEGIYDKGERYNRDFLVMDENKEYKITLLNDICYNPANLKFGVICRNTYGSAIFSPIYVTYEINHQYDPHFIELYLTNEDFIGRVLRYEQGTVYERMAVSSDDFLRSIIYLPSRNEQERISKIFSIIENKLSIEQAILKKYKEQKKFLLSNMFI